MNALGILDSVRIETDLAGCEQCGSTSRVGRGICLNCLLHGALADIEKRESLEVVLDEVDVRDSDWRIGNYQILEEIGRGGMGVIYRARQRHSRRIVALKRLLSFQADSHETLARFRREAEAAASLDHPNILPIYEVSETDDGLPFFSMKFAAGGSLLDRAPVLRTDSRRSVALMAKVAGAVEYAHRHGILHRDLKPGNILLDACGEPLVSDFGLAKWLDASTDLTRTLTIFGTPGYIAPEQFKRSTEKLTPAADIYSLGAILFELFAGRPPFLGEHALAVIQQASEKPAPKLRSLLPGFDRDLETICALSLERDPAARYRSAAAFAHDLECWLEGKPIKARRALPSTRIWRWSQRNRKVAAIAIVCFALGIAVIWLGHSKWKTAQAIAQMKVGSFASEKSIAVLPFQNLSSEKDDAFFAEGVQDGILAELAKVADLKVISRTSVMQYKQQGTRNLREIAGQLGVAHVLEGSVLRAGGRIRVVAQLIDARRDAHLWAQRYDRDVADVFAIQNEIAKTTADQLQAQLLPREKAAMARPPTIDLVASRLYFEARQLEITDPTRKANLSRATRLLEEAVARDPHFTLAYCLLSRVHLDLFWNGFDHTPARLQLANIALQNASRLEPDAGEVRLARAIYAYRGFRDYDRARAELDMARDTLPNNADVFFLTACIDRRQGRWSEAIRRFDRAIDLDPRNLHFLEEAALRGLRSYAESNKLFRRALEISPHDHFARIALAENAFHERGDVAPLRAEVSNILAEEPGSEAKIAWRLFFCAMVDRDSAEMKRVLPAIPAEGIVDEMGLPRDWYVGLAARTLGDEATAHSAFQAARVIEEKVITDQPDYAEAWILLGIIDAGLGRKEDAVREGLRGCELLPPSKDPWASPCIRGLPLIYAWAGEKDLAIEQLERAKAFPASSGVTYGDLKLNPQWDSLRGDPRFEQIVASLAPKEKL